MSKNKSEYAYVNVDISQSGNRTSANIIRELPDNGWHRVATLHGTALCSPDDEFDWRLGVAIATCRALGFNVSYDTFVKEEPEKTNVKVDSNRTTISKNNKLKLNDYVSNNGKDVYCIVGIPDEEHYILKTVRKFDDDPILTIVVSKKDYEKYVYKPISYIVGDRVRLVTYELAKARGVSIIDLVARLNKTAYGTIEHINILNNLYKIQTKYGSYYVESGEIELIKRYK